MANLSRVSWTGAARVGFGSLVSFELLAGLGLLADFRSLVGSANEERSRLIIRAGSVIKQSYHSPRGTSS